MKIKISVIREGDEFFAQRSFEDLPSPPGLVFSLVEDVNPHTLSAFEERVKKEARRRLIDYVAKLD